MTRILSSICIRRDIADVFDFFTTPQIATRTRNATTNQFVYGEPGIR